MNEWWGRLEAGESLGKQAVHCIPVLSAALLHPWISTAVRNMSLPIVSLCKRQYVMYLRKRQRHGSGRGPSIIPAWWSCLLHWSCWEGNIRRYTQHTPSWLSHTACWSFRLHRILLTPEGNWDRILSPVAILWRHNRVIRSGRYVARLATEEIRFLDWFSYYLCHQLEHTL